MSSAQGKGKPTPEDEPVVIEVRQVISEGEAKEPEAEARRKKGAKADVSVMSTVQGLKTGVKKAGPCLGRVVLSMVAKGNNPGHREFNVTQRFESLEDKETKRPLLRVSKIVRVA